MKKIIPVLAVLAIVFLGCKKDDPKPDPVDPGPQEQGTVSLDFRNMVGDQDLVFNQYYLNPSADSFKVSKFNYYISNVVLVKADNSTFVQPESYFVVRHPDIRKLTLTNVPPGTYNRIRLLIGVDSTRNTSGAQTGGLDLASNGDMFWSWNSGYIFMKIEGSSPASGADSKALTFHIGGFKGEYRTQRSVEISLGSTPLVVNNNQAIVNLKADLNEVFTSPHAVDFSSFYYQMQPGEGAKKLADNYSNMISLESVQN